MTHAFLNKSQTALCNSTRHAAQIFKRKKTGLASGQTGPAATQIGGSG
jgi:hypothetical protein